MKKTESHFAVRGEMFKEPADALLADVAIRIQLSPTAYDEAVQRHESIKVWIERADSPLHGLVELFYPQGSMATRSTIAARLRTDEFDIDIVAALLLDAETLPSEVLDNLYRGIRGEPGSRYYKMTERRTRCVTVHYADAMHLDVTPMVRRPATPERESWLFHHREGTAREHGDHLIANPFGFSEWFNNNTPRDQDFVQQYGARSREYERMILAGRTEDDPVPPQESPGRKSKAVIVLQLIKRWRNVQYDRRPGRRPPSILLSKLVADNAGKTDTLSHELCHQAQQMLSLFEECQAAGTLIRAVNPECAEDVLTDRWPASSEDQSQFIADLRELVKDAERLVKGCELVEMRAILAKLFGENPTGAAVEAYVERLGKPIRQGQSRHESGTGRLVVPAVATSIAAMPVSSSATPKHTHYGEVPAE